MTDFGLLVKRGDRLGSNDLAAGRVNLFEGDGAIHHSQSRLDHVAAIVRLGNDPVGMVMVIRIDGSTCPVRGRVAAGQVLQNVSVLPSGRVA